MIYKVAVTWSVYDTYDVEANSLEEAIQLIQDGDKPYDKLPESPEYVDDSLVVDIDITKEINSDY